MKTIQKIQELFNIDLKPSVKLLTFSFRGVKIPRKGYAIETNTPSGLSRLEAITIEPIQSKDYKWFVYGGFIGNSFYAKNINQVYKKLSL